MRMRRFSFAAAFLCIFCLALPALAAADAVLYSIVAVIPLYGRPSDSARPVGTLKAGTKVLVDPRGDAWGAVFPPQAQASSAGPALGYVRLADLRDRGIVEIPHTKGKLLSMEETARSGHVAAGGEEKAAGGAAAGGPAEPAPAKRRREPKAEAGKAAAASMGARGENSSQGGATSAESFRRKRRREAAAKTQAPEPAARKKEKPSRRKAKKPAPPAFGELRVAAGKLMVRAGRDRKAKILRILSAGEKVRVDFRGKGWFAVFDPAETQGEISRAWGYSRDKYLVTESEYRAGVREEKPKAEAVSPAFGELRVAAEKVVVRAGRDRKSKILRVLPAGRKVRVDFRGRGWCAVFDAAETQRDLSRAWGYAREKELVTESAYRAGREGKPKAEAEAAESGTEKAAKSGKSSRRKAKKPAPPAFGELRVAAGDLMVRAGRDRKSKILRILSAGQKVRVDFRGRGWYAVFDPAETQRDLSRAWGYARDKYLVTESGQGGPTEIAKPQAESGPAAKTQAEPRASAANRQAESTVDYAVLSRRRRDAEAGKGKSPKSSPHLAATMRVRLSLSRPPARPLLRGVIRGIWRAEHKKGEDLRIEVLLKNMDARGVAYAVARFSADGREREFWCGPVPGGPAAKK